MSKYIKMSDDEWFEKFKPIENPTADSGLHIDNVGYMFETYGPDHDKVVAANPACVWTLLDCDNVEVIGEGYHWVNRIGYFITEVPAEPDVSYEILYWEEPECSECGSPPDADMAEDDEDACEFCCRVKPKHDNGLADIDKYEKRVQELEAEGCTRSDAQGIADVEFEKENQDGN